MAKSTKVMDLAATLNMDGQQLIEQINALGLGFSVRAKTSALTDEQVAKIKQALDQQRHSRSTTAIDAKSQSTGKGTVRIRRRRDDDSADKSAAGTAKAAAAPAADTAKPEAKPTVAVRKAPEKKAAAAEEKAVESAARQAAAAPAAEETAPVQNADSAKEAAATADVVVADKDNDAAKTAESVVTEDTKAVAEVPEKPETAADKPEEPEPAADAAAANDAENKPVNKNAAEPAAASSIAEKAAERKLSEKEKKAAKKAEKEKKKNEKIIEIAPKFGKDVTISFGSSSFADEVPEEYASEISDLDELEEEEQSPRSKWNKPKANKKSVLSSVDDGDDDMGDDDVDDAGSRKKIARPSNITGAIDPALIRAMLVKDNKKFGGNGGNENGKSNKKSGARTVVNSSQFYNTQNNSPKANASHSGAAFKKVNRPKKGAPVDRAAAHPMASEHKRVIKVSENIAVGTLANDLGVKASEVIRFLMKELGMMVTVNQTVDVETAELVATEYGFTVQDVSFKEESFTESETDKPEDLELRAPIVTVMGHVDHGKTSLLDALRNSRVAAGEAGGITQHIGASSIDTPNGRVVFLDTPGHEAFTSLRARGAKVTDLVVLVVAADDGVMPQTVEAINHAKAANVPIIVAINKIDKPGANPERVRQALTEYELIPEEWGGTTIFKEVSAKQGTGVDELLELIELQSEVLELKANPDKPARGFVLEAYKDNRKGTVASILVQEGTLRINDILVSGACYGKVKSMTNERGKNVRVAEPSTPVEITGLSDVPDAGEPFFVAKDEKIAKEFTTQIKERKRNAELSSKKFDPWAQFKDNKTLNVIIKADVQGSLEALVKSLGALSTEDVELQIVHAAVGGATENDVSLAVASNAIIVGFNTRPDARAAEIAKREGVLMESFNVIYDIIDYVKDAMSGLLDPIIGENVLGHVEIRNTFNVPKVGTIAGGYVTDGIIRRGAKCRLLRQGKIIYDSKVASLKRFKDDAKEVRTGFECGFSIENYNDVKVDDVVEVYEVTETKQSL
ncbi:MAG: translation initiation factor IF-2 [Proteobacteria bacterium]|nr:translation initiation factor IF-2 [Pseudomonadota bacterium]